MFGVCNPILVEMLSNISKGIDPFLIGVDFKSYIEAQVEIDKVFSNKEEFCKRTMLTIANCGYFSSDKSI
jgi:starch phosphorylase